MRLDSFSLANGKILAHSTRKHYYYFCFLFFHYHHFYLLVNFWGMCCHAVFDCGRFHFRPFAMGISNITRSSVTISKYTRCARTAAVLRVRDF